jgi:bifunctional DNA-binding transcriptional regulator/antitoxin component of YhaV-PrlF toxin-antitoxin module
MGTKVGQKGQVTIEAPIREAPGIEPGWRAVQRAGNGTVVMRFLPPSHHRSLAGVLRDATTVTIPTEEDLDRAIAESWTMPDPEPGDADA